MILSSFFFLSLVSLPTFLAALQPPLQNQNQTWDYIIVGSGAGGIPLADRLSEVGKSVLLIERGFASSGRWGGTWKPIWLEGTNLTRFDVPALAQLVWQPGYENEKIFCQDAGITAGCLLGGGTAINAGQFYLPTQDDFDLNQPAGFRWTDVRSAFNRAKTRLPWTDTPSLDGRRYLTNGTQIAINALTNSSLSNPYRFITANDKLDDRDHVSSFAEYFFINGEKGGPMATYLVSASRRKNFHLQMNTTVTRVLRKGDTATGVEVEATSPGGWSGTINITPGSGRVILSAGVFNTFKILLRSGIGPSDQLSMLSKHYTEAAKLPPKKQWIVLPVGYNLDDSPSVSLALGLPYLELYPWDTLWNSTIDRPEVEQYLDSRSGPLAEIQPSLGPISWDKIKGADGRMRVVQWDVNTAVVPSLYNGGILVFASNLNLGKTSRGRLTIVPDSRLFVNVSTPPYFNDEGDHDFKAMVTSATQILSIMQTISSSTILFPPPGLGVEDYIRAYISQQALTRNHWVGTTKMGESCADKDAVVDNSTRICGMKNLHVVDAGIVNGVPTANPQAMFIVVAERAAEVVLRMDGFGGKASNHI